MKLSHEALQQLHHISARIKEADAKVNPQPAARRPAKHDPTSEFRVHLSERVMLDTHGYPLAVMPMEPGDNRTLQELARILNGANRHDFGRYMNGLTPNNVRRAASELGEVAEFRRRMVTLLYGNPQVADAVLRASETAVAWFENIISQETAPSKATVDQAIRFASGTAACEAGPAVDQAVRYAQYNDEGMARLWSSRDRNVFKDISGRNVRMARNAARISAMLMTLGKLTDRWLATVR